MDTGDFTGVRRWFGYLERMDDETSFISSTNLHFSIHRHLVIENPYTHVEAVILMYYFIATRLVQKINNFSSSLPLIVRNSFHVRRTRYR